jgi:hypothetical protein
VNPHETAANREVDKILQDGSRVGNNGESVGSNAVRCISKYQAREAVVRHEKITAAADDLKRDIFGVRGTDRFYEARLIRSVGE